MVILKVLFLYLQRARWPDSCLALWSAMDTTLFADLVTNCVSGNLEILPEAFQTLACAVMVAKICAFLFGRLNSFGPAFPLQWPHVQIQWLVGFKTITERKYPLQKSTNSWYLCCFGHKVPHLGWILGKNFSQKGW